MTNLGTAARRTRFEYCAHWERLAAAVEKIFPRKTAFHLSALTGLRPRACFEFLGRRSGLSSDALVPMLRTKHGPAVLRALLGDDCREPWWIEFQVMWRRVENEQWERDLRGIDDQHAQAPAPRRHQAVREVRQAGASTASAPSSVLKGRHP
jgi:hypothetical protein